MLMELHKHDGRTEGSVIVELVSDAPKTHVWSGQYVDREVANGWLEFTGKKVSYKVTADPLGEMRNAGDLSLSLPGDHLVMHVEKDGKPVDLTYRITHYPVPRGFRLGDDREPDGIRAANEYGLELVEG